MKRGKSTAVTLDDLYAMGAFIGTTTGEDLVRRFCADVEAGREPSRGDLVQLADSLEALLGPVAGDNGRRDSLGEFARRLRIARKQGRRSQQTFAEVEQMAAPVVDFLIEKEQLIRAGKPANIATQKARQYAIEKFRTRTGKELSDKALRDRINKYKEVAKSTIQTIALLQAYDLLTE